MARKRPRAASIVGLALSLLCCMTPALVVPLGAIGISAGLRWLDDVLFAAMAIFAALALYAMLTRGHRRRSVSR